MKAIRLFRTGSDKEAHFLKNMLNQHFLLTKKTGCVYSFIQDSSSSKDLVIEFIDKESFIRDSDLRSSFENQTTSYKKLFLAPFFVCYTYLQGENFANYSNEVSDDIQLDYLNYRDNQSKKIGLSIILLGILAWFFIEWLLKDWSGNAFTFTMLGLILLWFINLANNIYLSKKKDQLEIKLGKPTEMIFLTLNIAIRNIPKKPDITKLSYLGNWSFVNDNQNKQEYFFKLKTSLGREEVKTDISEFLGIPRESISISTPADLFGFRL
ncbi:hypothetical protein DOK76_11215 [Vagococcus sp. DIV0080]|uniref:DUF2812 domain-containing protein n=1 Tax=Candidatus Vagococcus giribetii TaxID=2230876 RepID=A0ABS3HVC1_9ENTE|nr:hypothetical protein [Vagococcus sp. DIV0080]MBO0477645.1 hypothetical protein [Vagococcus sp. DIV0080]